MPELETQYLMAKRLQSPSGEASPPPAEVAPTEPHLEALSAALARSRAEVAAAVEARRRAEAAASESADRLLSMLSAVPVGVMTIDRSGRIETWNRAAEEMLGYPASEMIGQPMPTTLFTAPQGGGTGAAGVYLRIVTGQAVKGEEVHCRRKDGSCAEASFSGVALMDEEERLRCAICVFEDIGPRNAVARQLQHAQKMEAVGQLTGGLAHDFNNILGIAVGNLDLLQDIVADRHEAKELAETALNALLRGAELTRALLAFSRRQPLRPVRLDVAEQLSTATRLLRRVLGEQVVLSFHAQGDLWPVVLDAAQLEAAITNLAINARDAMPSGGRLTVGARNVVLDGDYVQQNVDAEPGEYVLIEITDTGTGMPPDVAARVFEPFFTTKPVGKGTGLGLSMVYGFIKQSGGHIKIYSEVGSGTTVRLYLPRCQIQATETNAPSAAPPLARGHGEIVLVVEDNPDVRAMVQGQLRRLGYAVIAAGDGPEGLALLESSQRIDLLFTDVIMPGGMSGFELAEAALERRPALKVVFTSGFPGTAMDARAVIAAKAQFLGKPYRQHELARIVRDVLDDKGAAS